MNPFAFMSMPLGLFTGQEPQSITHGHEPPARVRIALALLQQLTLKTMERPAINDVGIEVLPGQKLTTAESNAQAAAGNLLADYLGNKMLPDLWEQAQLSLLTSQNPAPNQKGMVIRCLACQGIDDSKTCVLCRGAGHLLVYPAAGGRE